MKHADRRIIPAHLSQKDEVLDTPRLTDEFLDTPRLIIVERDFRSIDLTPD
jgi:hypothetical protein